MTTALEHQLRETLRAAHEPAIRAANPRRTHLKSTEWSPEHLAARADFKARWEAIHEEGERLNFLVWSGGYDDGSWEVDISGSYEDGEEFTETEVEYEARIRVLVNRRVEAELAEITKRLKP